MKICKNCNQEILCEEEFKKRIGSAYLTAINDKQFLEWLKERDSNE
jgi:hypothetical protein